MVANLFFVEVSKLQRPAVENKETVAVRMK